jgi:hypothetical protein
MRARSDWRVARGLLMLLEGISCQSGIAGSLNDSYCSLQRALQPSFRSLHRRSGKLRSSLPCLFLGDPGHCRDCKSTADKDRLVHCITQAL